MIVLNKYKNKIIAHRGVHNNIDIPENSLKAFELAITKKYPIELDIHLTKDNKLVVFHDDNLKRMTGKNTIIETLALSEIKRINLLKTKEKIPTLEEVLKLVNNQVLIDIEIKGKKRIKKLVEELLKLLETYNGEIIIKSFNPLAVKEVKRKTNKYLTGLLLSYYTDSKSYNILARTNFFIPYSKPDFLALDKKLLTKHSIKKYLPNYPIMIWTIKKEKEIININNKEYIYISNNLIQKRKNL